MTPTDVNLPRHVALYREVCQRPECDTLRLAYADALDELGDERVECPKCNGNRGEYKVPGFTVWGCQACEVTGTVLSTANRDRAEFIRVGCELAREPHCVNCGGRGMMVYGSFAATCRWCPRWQELSNRSTTLLDAHPEWRKCPCPVCGGTNRTFDACPCGGSGDLFQPFGDGAKPRTVTFSRGFVDSVECTAADVWREGVGVSPSGGTAVPVTVPTEWAKAAERCTPCVRFVATDLAPRHVSDVLGKGWTWPRRMTLPDPVRDLLASTGGVQQPAFNSGYVRWETEQLCRDALAVALGKWVRVAAYPAASVG